MEYSGSFANSIDIKVKSFWRSTVTRWLLSIQRATGGFCLGPLTTRSILALLLSLYLLIGPISTSTDIISASLTYTFLVILSALVTTLLVHGIFLKHSLSIEVLPPSEVITSNRVARIGLRLHGVSVLPLFMLDLLVEFEHPNYPKAVLRLSGLNQHERQVFIDLVFPHRGSWNVSQISCSLGDLMGLLRFSWRAPQTTAITVMPAQTFDTHLPILSSTQRAGDLMVDIFNRQGDPFEIKNYHPSDGIKKIVWKAFAKRGELLSRHPEASMTPEGFVVIFVIADNNEDDVCAEAVAYTESLARLNLELIASCEGANGRAPTHSSSTFKELLVDAVWGSINSDQDLLKRDAAALLDYCNQMTPSVRVNKLLIFISGKSISNPQRAQHIHDLAAWLANQGVAPVFCISRTDSQLFSSTPIRSKLLQLERLFISPPTPSKPLLSAAAYNEFLTTCLRMQWEVHV